jgi:hypothetical protein
MYLFVCMYVCMYVNLLHRFISFPSVPCFIYIYLFIHYSADTLLMHFKSNGFVRCLVVFTFIDDAFFQKLVKLFKSTNDITIPGQDLAVVF